MENATVITDNVRGVGKCPYSPLSNITAMITLNGQYFAGSPMDFSGADSAIVRDLGASYLRTKNYDAKWLNEPQFVGSFETDSYVYFLFRESAVEYINCGKVRCENILHFRLTLSEENELNSIYRRRPFAVSHIDERILFSFFFFIKIED